MSWRINSPRTNVSRWMLQNAVGTITPDAYGRYPGTMVNAPTWGVGPFGGLQCIELDGNNQYVNLGDIVELNDVSAFTLCFWMNQDVIGVQDFIFQKGEPNASLCCFTSGNIFYFMIVSNAARAQFDYSTVIFARNWHHIAWVFDGSQTGNANRTQVYIDGSPVTLVFVGTIQDTTKDAPGVDVMIGRFASSFDGRLWDERLYNVPLSRDEVNRIIHGPVPVV